MKKALHRTLLLLLCLLPLLILPAAALEQSAEEPLLSLYSGTVSQEEDGQELVAYVQLQGGLMFPGQEAVFTVHNNGSGDYDYSYVLIHYAAEDKSENYTQSALEWQGAYYPEGEGSTLRYTPADSGIYCLILTITDKNSERTVTLTNNYVCSALTGGNSSIADRVLSIVSDTLAQGGSQREQARYVHDVLIENAYYDSTYSYYYPDGVLLHGTGVCQSYALAYEMILERLGIPCLFISGYANEYHAWNLVYLEGKWWHVDCTWDDPKDGSNSPLSGAEKDFYFCIEDAIICADHAWDRYSYPVCNGSTLESHAALNRALRIPEAFSLTDDQGRVYNRETLVGQPTVFIFGYDWCGWTQVMHSYMQQMHELLESRGIRVIAVVQDADAELLASLRSDYPSIIQASGIRDTELQILYGENDWLASPTVGAINADGIVTYAESGASVENALRVMASSLVTDLSSLFDYSETESGAEILAYKGADSGEIAYPATIHGKTVTKLPDWGSGDCGTVHWVIDAQGVLTLSGSGEVQSDETDEYPWTALSDKVRELRVGGGVTAIGTYAFWQMKNLQSVELAEGVRSVDYGAFMYCKSLRSISIPASVTSFGYNIFWGCSALESVIYGGRESKWKSFNIELPEGCELSFGNTGPAKILYSGTCGASLLWTLDEDYTLSISGSGEMGNFAYAYDRMPPWYDYRDQVRKLVLGEGVTSVGNYAFLQFSVLETVELPSTLKSIGTYAFCYCYSLKALTIPFYVERISYLAFEQSYLKELCYEGKEERWNTLSVDELGKQRSLRLPENCVLSFLGYDPCNEGHLWGKTEYVWSKDYNSCKATRICQRDSSHVESVSASVTTETLNPGCGIDGSIGSTANFSVDWAEQQRHSVGIPALSHAWVFMRVDTSATPYYNVYRCENCTETKREELPPAPAETVELDCGKELIVDVGGEAVTINATISPINAQQGVSWSGMNSAYGEFEQQGSSLTFRNFTGKTGSLTLSATATDGSKKKATVKIKFVRLMRDDDLDFAETAALASGKALTLKATVAKGVSNTKLSYTMDINPYATLKGDKLTAAKTLTEPQTVTVTATAQDGSGVSKSCAVTLYPIATSVNISGAPENTVDLSETVQLSASVAPLNACQQVTWKSSSKSVTIDENGTVTVAENAKAATVTFTATAADGSGKKGSVKVKFVRLMRDEDVTMDTDYVLAAGKSVQFKPVVNKAVTNPKFTYTMPESEFATLKNGKLTAAKLITEAQTLTVTATAQDGSEVSRELHVTLYPAVKAVHIYNSIGEDVTGKTLDFSGKLSLRLANEPYNAAQRWTVKSSSKAVSAQIYGDSVTVSLASALKVGSKFTLSFTAADGSGKSAKVNFKYTGEPTDYKIAIMTGNATQATEEYNAARMLADADPEHVLMDTYTDDFATGVDITVEKLLAFAADPEVKAILFVQAVQGCSEAFAQIREERPDILLIAGIPAEDSATVTAAADVVLANDELACGYQVADKAAEWGCDVLVHYSFERHLGYETIVTRRDSMKLTAEAHGIAFVERDAPDPTGDAGASGAQAFILEDVPRVMEEYAGKKVCFYCTNCGMQVALQQAVLAAENAYYALPCCPGPFHGFQEAFGLESSYSDFEGSLRIVAEYLNEYNACGRFSTWAVPVNMGALLGGYEYASAWCKGELSRKLDLTKLTECMSKATDTDAELGVYHDPQGNAYENYRLISFEPIDFMDYLLTPGSAVI